MDERHVKTDINLRESKVSVIAVPLATFPGSTGGGPMSHLPIFRLALLTVPDVIFSFVQVFKVANRQFIGFLTLSRCILSVTLS